MLKISTNEEKDLRNTYKKLKHYIDSWNLPVTVQRSGNQLFLRDCNIPCHLILDKDMLYLRITIPPHPTYVDIRCEFPVSSTREIVIKLIRDLFSAIFSPILRI